MATSARGYPGGIAPGVGSIRQRGDVGGAGASDGAGAGTARGVSHFGAGRFADSDLAFRDGGSDIEGAAPVAAGERRNGERRASEAYSGRQVTADAAPHRIHRFSALHV